jgi:uncharacterized protein (TIGR04222 family)
MSLGPYDLTAGPFLTLYLMLFTASTMLSLIIPALLRPAGREQPVTDPDQLAWLNGGATRMAESAVTRLMVTHGVEQGVGDSFTIDRAATAAGTVETGIMRLSSPSTWATIARSAADAQPIIETRMTSLGLLIHPELESRLRLWQTAPLALLILFGIPKLFVGVERERPIGFLTALLIVTAIVAAIRYFVLDRRTGAAISALSAAKANSHRLRIAPTRPEMGLAVALFGTSVLAGSYYESLHKLRQTSGDGSSSSSDSSSDGGGSDGGGCGGCGGD